MPNYELHSTENLATQADINHLNESTPNPADIDAVRDDLSKTRTSLESRLENLEHKVNKASRLQVIAHCFTSLILFILLGAIVYKLYAL